jgi:hypothetical protein
MKARRHYEILDSTPAHADIVGAADTFAGALVVYVRARRARRDHTINVLVDDDQPEISAGAAR